MGGKQTATLLNFAEIHLEKSKMLGHGSFSKVYRSLSSFLSLSPYLCVSLPCRGSYRSTPCAIKLIFTDDLTEDVILRAEAEATLLSSVKSPNIVNIIGVSVLPPSVCIVLELCAYGSLSDVIRGDLGAHSKAPMSLSLIDRLYLALGCARSVLSLFSLPLSLFSLPLPLPLSL
jgi:serine/threonine protein kinase